MTISQEPRPDLVRRIGAMGPNVGGAEYLISLQPDELIETAVRATGLADFGPPSPANRPSPTFLCRHPSS